MTEFFQPDAENAYMDQEEDWDREGLLDPAWEKQQRKVSFDLQIFLLTENFIQIILVGTSLRLYKRFLEYKFLIFYEVEV